MRLDSVRQYGTAFLWCVSLAEHADTNQTAAELGLMQGFPPPSALQVTTGNFMAAPNNRWSFQHIRELHPTREVYRGGGPVAKLSDDTLDLACSS